MDLLKRKMSKRGQVIGAIFLLLFFVMLHRFYSLQIVDASFLQEQAERMYNRESILKAKRGSILDRNGTVLAQEGVSYTVYAILSPNSTNRIDNPVETAEQLAPILNMSVESLVNLMSREGVYQVELRPGGRKVDKETKLEIENLKLPGIGFIEESKRYYPLHTFASHILGFVNLEGEAVMGLEKHKDHLLTGTDGRLHFKRDVRNNLLPHGIQSIERPKDGQDIYLTLDERIQTYAEEALNVVEQEFGPEGITVIVSNPQTGEILAMASRPSFDPNNYSQITNYLNHAVSSVFEPGSTFKVITLAAAIEEGIYNSNETYMSGVYHVPGGQVRDHNRYGWGEITFLEGVQKSSNVAFAILGWERMQRETFYSYIDRFGFGQRTGIDLPGEHQGFVRHSRWDLDRANMAFGQGVAVTAIQQIAAINAIANGGTLLKPYIIDRIIDSETDEVIFEGQRQVVNQQVVSASTAKEVRDILETVVTHGTGQNYYIEGYQVAGKTGTAQKVGPDGKYMTNKHIHSFIGFAPKDDPILSVYVAVDAPQVESFIYGGAVVAQIFKYVMQNSLQYLSVTPVIEEYEIHAHQVKVNQVGQYVGISTMTARQRAEHDGHQTIIVGDGPTVLRQIPGAGEMIYPNERLYLFTSTDESVFIPDLTGWSLKATLDWAQMAGVQLDVQGHGYVESQSIEEGTKLNRRQRLSVTLRPRF